jgi:phosphatidylinositol alpha-1,6-mannosyltransferase
MRVAYIVPPIEKPTGYRRYACGVISAISQYVEPILFVPVRDHKVAESFFSVHQVTTIAVTMRASFQRIRSLPRLLASWWAICSRDHPDVDLVHSLEAYPTGLIGNWLAWKQKVPHVLSAVGTYSIRWQSSPLDRLAYSSVLRRAAVLCPISHGTAGLIRKHFGDAVADIWIHPILLGNRYYEAISRSEVIHRQPAAIPTILSVGAVKPRKGYHVSLQAFARVKKDISSARYWIVGDIVNEPYHRDLLQFIATHQLEDVEFLGVVSEERLRQCYREASVFLLAPQQIGFQFEGFGLVYLEAGAYGLPVVGTRTGGVPDAVRDGETGFLVKPDDVDSLAGALKRLLTDAKLAHQMGLANREWAETLTWERYAKEQFEVYQKVVSNHRYGD